MRARLLIMLSVILFAAPQLAAQDPVDSLRQRLEDMERLLQVLQVQVAEQAEGGVETRSGARVELSGLVLFNGFYNDGPVNNGDVPLIAAPGGSYGAPPPANPVPSKMLGGTARQSRILFTTFVPDVLGAEFTGVLDIDFFGGHQSLGRLFPLPHLRIMRGELRWSNTWLRFGHDAPPISDVNPSSAAAIGIPGFSMSGNLWFWIPQVRVGVETGLTRDLRLGLEAAALAPHVDGAATGLFPEPNLGEQSGRPYLQGRLIGRWGDPALGGGEASIGGHYGWIATDGDSLLVTKAVGATAQLFLTRFLELRGEAFMGQALAVLGGGGVGQDFGAGGAPISTAGGWAQLNVLPLAGWEVGAGVGVDNPDDADFAVWTGRLRNISWEGHVIWRPSPLLFALEYRRIETSYGETGVGIETANHINLAMGFAF